ncbi:MAG: hypothetical protein HDR17_09665 [Lachnospiraceae bacterium]|nr:hypothetical protein [Lachnospiraceae bacterium]MBD5502531.1 hypothetical protein [Lachnospiraceae bacterium]
MSSVETYYLVDFENVHEDGLSGSEQLGNLDHIYLFLTKNAPKLNVEKLASNSITVSIHKVPSGNQSLDMHLVSYLGYLIGKNINKCCKYVIISKDTDYDNIISFYKHFNDSDIDIRRQDHIKTPSKNNSSKTVSPLNSTNTSGTKSQKATASQTKCQLNTEVQRALSKANYTKSDINKTASIVVKYYGKDQFANNVHNELRNTCPNHSSIYQIVKPIINKYSSSQTQTANTTTSLNSTIQKLLSKAGFSSDIINHTASLVSKNYQKENGKQSVYRAIVAKYGQKQGLNIYNHIKKHF